MSFQFQASQFFNRQHRKSQFQQRTVRARGRSRSVTFEPLESRHFFAGVVLAENILVKPAVTEAREPLENAFVVQAADLDGDSDLDVIAAGPKSVVWFENLDGRGQFGTQRVVSKSTGGNSIQVVDLNGDGNQDIVAGREGGDFDWFVSSGNGNFARDGR